MLADATIRGFLDEAASAAPTPGGGGIAALSGALAAAMLSMVCRLTLGKEKYRDVEEELQSVLAETETLRAELLGLVAEDARVFGRLSAAMKMPRTNDEEKAARTKAIQEALVMATDVPMEIARRCARVVELAPVVAEKGNANALTDAGVGAVLSEAAMQSALLNVKINLGLLKDQNYVGITKKAMTELAAGKRETKDAVSEFIDRKLGFEE